MSLSGYCIGVLAPPFTGEMTLMVKGRADPIPCMWGYPSGCLALPNQLPPRILRCWAHSNTYPIYDLLENLKGPVLQNQDSRISMTCSNNSLDEDPVLMM